MLSPSLYWSAVCFLTSVLLCVLLIFRLMYCSCCTHSETCTGVCCTALIWSGVLRSPVSVILHWLWLQWEMGSAFILWPVSSSNNQESISVRAGIGDCRHFPATFSHSDKEGCLPFPWNSLMLRFIIHRGVFTHLWYHHILQWVQWQRSASRWTLTNHFAAVRPDRLPGCASHVFHTL